MTTKTKTELVAPPIVELAYYEGDPDPREPYVIQSGDDRFPGSSTGPAHPEGQYLVLGRDRRPDGSEWLVLGFGLQSDAADSVFAVPPAPPFRVPAAKVRKTWRVSWYSTFISNPWDNWLSGYWRNAMASIFGPDAAEAEWNRIQALGHAAWCAEREALLEAGLIPNN